MLEMFCKIFLLAITFFHFIAPYVPFSLTNIIFILGIGILIAGIPLMGKSFRIPLLIFLSAGIFIIIYSGQPFSVFIAGTNSMLNIVSILVVMQFFSIPIQLGNYGRALETLLLKYLKKEQHLFLFTTIISHMFASFLLFGTIPVMISLLGDVIKRNVTKYERFMAAALTRGYPLIVIWAPGAVMVLLVLRVTGMEWSDIFLPGITLSIIGILTSVFLEGRFVLSKEEIIPNGISGEQDDEMNLTVDEKVAWRNSLDIILVVVGMIVTIYFLETLEIFSSFYCVMLAGFMVSALWTIKYIRHADLKRVIKEYWKENIIKSSDLAALFVAVGIFARAIESGGFADYFFGLVSFGQLGYLTFVLIPLLIILFSVIGINPVISIVLVGQLFSPAQQFFPTVAIALALSLGTSISFMISPFAGIVLTMAKFTDSNPFNISLRWNGPFSLVFLAEGLLYIFVIIMLFG